MLKEWYQGWPIMRKGGKGSGHPGHAGVPGKQGGSAPAGTGSGGGGTGERVATISAGPGATEYDVKSGDQTLNLDARDTPPSALFDALAGQAKSGDVIRLNVGRGQNRITPAVEREALRRAGLSGTAAAKQVAKGFIDVVVP